MPKDEFIDAGRAACDDVSVGIETEKLDLIKFSAVGGPGNARLRKANGEEFPLAPEHEWFLDLALRGISPQQMALHGWSSGRAFSFRSLARFLAFLCEKQLVLNPSAYEFAESLRPGFAWRRSLISEPFFELTIGRWAPGARRPALALMLASFGCLLSALGLIYYLYLLGEAYHARAGARLIAFARMGTSGDLWPLLGWGILWFSAARSLTGAAKFILTRLASGESKKLSFALDLLSARFESSDASLSQSKSGAEAAVCLAALGAPFWLPLAALPFDLSPACATAAVLFIPLGALVEVSPFVRGPFTDVLRYLYNWRLEAKAKAPAREWRDPEGSVATLHVFCNIGWIFLASVFFAIPLHDFFRYARDCMAFSTFAAKASAAAFFGVVGLLAAAFLDDMINAISYGAETDRTGVRRIWRMRLRSVRDRARSEALDFKSRSALENAPLLRQLSPAAREHLIQRSSIVSYRKGEAICRQGENKRELYVLLSGRAAVEVRKSAGRHRRVMTIEAGSIFGEVGFFLGKPRTADVIALEPTVALEIRRDESAVELDPERSAELRDRIRFLQALASSSFLQNLPGEVHDALAALGQPRSFAAGEAIVREGEEGDECYFVVQGTASALQNGAVINRLGPGDAFGEIALLRLQPLRTATVMADAPLLTMELKGARLWELMSSRLLLAIEIERLAVGRLARSRGDSARL